MWHEIKKIIEKSKNFIITTHVNPDGDGVGSAVALMELLLQMNKHVKFVCDCNLSEKYCFLNFHDLFHKYRSLEELGPIEVFIVLDTYKEERIGKIAEIIQKPDVTTVCIDHHQAKALFTPYAVIDPHACSVGAMIYTLYKESGYELNLHAAMGIYTSVITDTGRFSYASTSRKAHKLADECIKVGVDPSLMFSKLFQQIPVDYVKIFSKSLSRMEFHLDDKILVQTILCKDYEGYDLDTLQLNDLEFFHEFNKSIKNVECAAVLFELPCEQVRVSLRSNLQLDIVQPMKKLGGGGHPNAAGALVQGTIDDVKKQILSLLKESFAAKDNIVKRLETCISSYSQFN